MKAIETLERRLLMSVSAISTVSITTRYKNELVITAAGTDDTVAIAQSGSKLSITADGTTSSDPAPAGGVFVYARGGKDSFTIASSVTAQTTIVSIDNVPTVVHSAGAHVIAWVDSTDIVTGTASVHYVATFAGGVSKKLGASLPNPSDSGKTVTANLPLLGTGPVAGDVNQGEMGDCYFMATLAAFANQRPGAIENSVVDLGDGTYAVEFYRNGKPVFVRVNNSFPAGPFEGFKFAHPGASGTIWAMVMEKAFAWFRDGDNTYASTSDGGMWEVYTDLNVTSICIQPPAFTDDQLFDLLSTDLKRGDPVTFETICPADLVANHVYTLVGLKIANGVNTYIVRNPWGDSGDILENSQGIAVLNYAQMVANFAFGAAPTTG
jgi:hypothetical protein